MAAPLSTCSCSGMGVISVDRLFRARISTRRSALVSTAGLLAVVQERNT